MIWTLAKEQPQEKLIELGKALDINPAVAKILLNKGFSEIEEIKKYLYGDISICHDPKLMKGIDKACAILMEKINLNYPIRVVGDYDVDGVTSTYILYDGLRSLGADVSYDIPHREKDGYGINLRMIEEAYEAGVDTIITCDNGIAAFEAIEKAREYDMTVVVTDHHAIPCELDEQGNKVYLKVPANAIVDNQQEDCQYPFKGLCGAGVAYKVIRHLYNKMGVEWEDKYKYFEFLALATTCDVMPLVDENRTYVKYGMEVLTDTTNIGLKALLRASKMEGKKINSFDLGFILGPCINAVGRMDDSRIAVELFLALDVEQAEKLANELVACNANRKNLTEIASAKGIAYVKEQEKLDDVLVVYLPEVKSSLAGLVASRILNEYNRPTIVLVDGENEMLHGSARSIEAFHMFDALVAVSDLLVKYGGHKQAAGLSLEKKNLEELRRRLNENSTLTEEDFEEKIEADLLMPMWYPLMNGKMIYDMELLEPFGSQNEAPIFMDNGVKIQKIEFFGKTNQFMKIIFFSPQGRKCEAKYFDTKKFIDDIKMWFGEEECDRMLNNDENNVLLDVIYEPSFDSYRGNNYPQVVIRKYKKSEEY